MTVNDYRSAGSITSFAVLRAPRMVLFGEGQRNAVAETVASLGHSVLICTDARLGDSPVLHALLDQLSSAQVSCSVYAEVEPELPVRNVLQCAMRIRHKLPDVIIGLGGGSCLDHAKLTALLLTHGGQLQDYYGEFKVPGPTIPVIAIPTTAGTGSEVTPVAVVADPDRVMKVGISSPYLIPHSAIVDPELTLSCPATLTAHAGADALAHCIEAFTARRCTPKAGLTSERVFVGKSAITDGFALAGIELIGHSLARAVSHGDDLRARGDLMLASLYGGLSLGTAGTAAAHALQYPVGAITHTPHGQGVGLLLPYVMQFNRPTRLGELEAVALALGDVPLRPATDDIDPAVHRVSSLLEAIGIPTTLQALGVEREQLRTIAEQAMTATRLINNNPRPLDVDALLHIAESAWTGNLADAT